MWNRRCLLVQEGLGPAEAWQRYHERPARLDLLALQWLASDVGPLDILPVHVGLAVERLDEGADGISVDEFSFWSDVGARAAAMAGTMVLLVGTSGLTREVANAGRALLSILGAVASDLEFIPPLCLLCRQPTFESCRVCRSIVRESCNSGHGNAGMCFCIVNCSNKW